LSSLRSAINTFSNPYDSSTGNEVDEDDDEDDSSFTDDEETTTTALEINRAHEETLRPILPVKSNLPSVCRAHCNNKNEDSYNIAALESLGLCFVYYTNSVRSAFRAAA